MRGICTLALLYLGTLCFCQSLPLHGIVAIQNSKYETGKRKFVSGASVRSQNAKPVTTDREGEFALDFVGVPKGMPIRVNVTKNGLTVVNTRDLEQVIVGRNDKLLVVMADPDKLAEAQVQFYHIATASIDKSYHARMDSLRSEHRTLQARLDALEKEFGMKVKDMNEAIEALTKQRDQAMSRAQDLANEFATVDLDGASELYIKAYELFKRGEVDSVLLVLNEERLQEEYQKAAKEKAKGKRIVHEADTVITVTANSYRLRADALLRSGQYADAYDQFVQLAAVQRRDTSRANSEDHLEVLHRIVWLHQGTSDVDSLLPNIVRSLEWTSGDTALSRIWANRLQRDRGLLLEAADRKPDALDAFKLAALPARAHADTVALAIALADQARMLAAIGMHRQGRAITDSSMALRPNAEAEWNKYRDELRKGKKKKALPHLIAAVRLWNADAEVAPWRKQQALEALKALATRLGRTDVLSEFGL